MVKAVVEVTSGYRRLRTGSTFLHCNNGAVPHQQRKRQSGDSVSNAKANFVSAVSQASSVLTEQCGYSHERATSALLRELSRGVAPPNDDEIFRTMHSCGVGSDEAVKILTVSRALKKSTSENGGSLDQAIDDLTSKLTLTNLVKQEDKPVSSSELGSACDSVSVSPRIKPVAAVAVPRGKVSQQPVLRKNKSVCKSSKPKLKPAAPSVITKGVVTVGRKRSIDDISNQVEKRDPLVSAVNAKIAKKAKKTEEENAAAENTPLRAVAGVRAKRSRVDDTDNCQTPLPFCE